MYDNSTLKEIWFKTKRPEKKGKGRGGSHLDPREGFGDRMKLQVPQQKTMLRCQKKGNRKFVINLGIEPRTYAVLRRRHNQLDQSTVCILTMWRRPDWQGFESCCNDANGRQPLLDDLTCKIRRQPKKTSGMYNFSRA